MNTPTPDLPDLHMGRSWSGHPLEDECPCPQEPCGLVSLRGADPECTEHYYTRSKTMRRGHPANRCPGQEDA